MIVRCVGALFAVLTVLWAQPGPFNRVLHPFDIQREDGRPSQRPFLGGYNTPRIQWSDYNDDALPDLFLQEHDDYVTLYLNTGSRTQPRLQWFDDDVFGIRTGAWFRLADVDNDGDDDLFCAGDDQTIRYFMRRDSDYVEASNGLMDDEGALILSELTSIPAFYDIDCDGDKDMFLGRQTGTITFYEHTGAYDNAGVPIYHFVMDNWQDIQIIGGGRPLPKSGLLHGANSLTFGDLNNDNAAEMIYGDFFSQSLYYFTNTGRCDSARMERTMDSYPPETPLLTSGFNAPSLFDVDGDGDLDLFATVLGGAFSLSQSLNSNFYYMENIGSAAQPEHIILSDNYLDVFDMGNECVPAVYDLDDDGDPDWILGNQTETIASSSHGQALVYRNTGSASKPVMRYDPSLTIDTDNIYNCAPEIFDLDDDGDPDMLMGRSNGKLAYFENQGRADNPLFVRITTKYMDIDVGSRSVPRLADWDGDGDADLCIGEFDGLLNFYENTGDPQTPQFKAIVLPVAGYQARGCAYPAFYDWDADGDPDLIVGFDQGEVQFFECTPEQDTLFHRVDVLNLRPARKTAPFIYDWDNDGDGDLLIGTQGGGLFAWEAGTPTAIVAPAYTPTPQNITLSEGWPNPFNGRIQFSLTIKRTAHVAASIYDVNGRRMISLYDAARQSPGQRVFQWDGRNRLGQSVASGIYWLVVHSGRQIQSRKIVYIK
ncbi:MAG: T9SS C-terminal target domain-containing protein [Calditrichaeota bacterium]|nr:MAG: T9SS C-terminal target domain-containing protein [Calditrichota bacterium]